MVEEHLKHKYELLHEYIVSYLEAHDCKIEDITLVEQTVGTKILTYLAKKSDLKW